MSTESTAARSAANLGDPLSRTALAASFRDAAGLCIGTRDGLAAAPVEIGLRIDPTLISDLGEVQQLLAGIAVLIESGDVYAASLRTVTA
ncbi:hypothetical protein Drose_05965 [Dactylosporangium roseum]|uniref:Uncharacterized protein n=1 Tax=Dactylosporangium roseum TaxID=47989 RepID=A0ABY5Z7J6_9ACTN|nr:hypothetical protein [Dactylosporangium roseum]UWZ37817.1 hypothetical protein Drose_05965 [Dactylosporangium roseum]